MVNRHLTGMRALFCAALCAIACEGVLNLGDADLIQAQPTLADAAGPLCRQYCDTVMANCTGAYAVYANSVQCLNLCRVMEPGSAGDKMGNTVACRLANAQLAADTAEPGSHCPQAGPGGAAAPSPAGSDAVQAEAENLSCSSNCEGLCTGMLALCPEQYTSLPGCLEDCSQVPDLGGYDISIGQGNSVQCRLFHLGAAAAAPDPHCAHAAGASPCR
jgi:hypothetical protein